MASDLIKIPKCMDYDDLAWERCENLFEPWKNKIFDREVLREIGATIDKYRGGVPDELFAPKRGAFNTWIRMKFKDGGSAVIRFPCPGASVFPEEKVKREIAVMRFLEHFTNIRVPHILHSGMTAESPCGLGPFIIMEYIDHDYDFIDALNIPGRSRQERPILNPDISSERLELVYRQMADILLQLSSHCFSEIGCISKANEDDEFDDKWVVKHRPLTFDMNELVQLGGFPAKLLPQHPFTTASSYYESLAEMHLAHLSSQRNDAIESAEDCRQKYIARCLFRKITREYQLCGDDSGPFKLFCDDFRPGNVLANAEFQMTGALDWEFTYAAPTGFAYSPPFWLILELPEHWANGLDDWIQNYEKVLPVFLRILREREQAAIDRHILKDTDRLSEPRKSWAFDMIYWAKIDRRFFGDGNLEDRLQLLTQEERDNMDAFIQRKLREKKERIYIGE
ncbi:hypothetical protein TSTA_062390 [Talaromyces stipitatus ATCC 10500]|uniref:Aminoglycoside phosphotransferase domain-containing protein n=1 Tax=Talaromyces stipitatus (strain ATCC 10500 / CBS 375.48 / QM 6759 / NRRL 1006) TaxID=441959 RepID=B8LXT7_TALSN|nr:uncharacterized protein TSTA_062390 [Talaromyces stipitatus ATCC 10500]EED22752.1 hypothetical protein TSTA_062390 [Talaromyces stipitatus ATCC 10500]